MNGAYLVGRLTRDPELRYTPAGDGVTNFTLAVDRPFKNANGENEADFIPVVCWKGLAETVANHLKKGRLAGVEGRIQTRNYENNDGQRVYVTEIVASNVRFLDKAPEQEGSGNANQSNTNRNTGNRSGGTNRGNGQRR